MKGKHLLIYLMAFILVYSWISLPGFTRSVTIAQHYFLHCLYYLFLGLCLVAVLAIVVVKWDEDVFDGWD